MMMSELRSLEKLHRLHPAVAADFGLSAAALFYYLNWLCEKRGRDGSDGVHQSLNRLTVVLAYLSKNEIRAALARLTGAPTRKSKKNPRPTSEDTPLPLLRRTGNVYRPINWEPDKRTYSFDPAMACKYGILAALIFDNLAYWIKVVDDETDDLGRQPAWWQSPGQWWEQHTECAALRTVEDAFARLLKAGELERVGYFQKIERIKKGRRVVGAYAVKLPKWTIPLGNGKLIRWRELHRSPKMEKVNKKERPKNDPVVLADPDIDAPQDSHTSPQDSHTPPQDSHTSPSDSHSEHFAKAAGSVS